MLLFNINKQMSTPILKLDGFTFNELFRSEGLNRLDQAFLALLKQKNPGLYTILLNYRTLSTPLSPEDMSEFLIHCAVILEEFIADLFSLQEALAISQIHTTSHNPLSLFKKYFVLRRAKKEIPRADTFPSFDALNTWL